MELLKVVFEGIIVKTAIEGTNRAFGYFRKRRTVKESNNAAQKIENAGDTEREFGSMELALKYYIIAEKKYYEMDNHIDQANVLTKMSILEHRRNNRDKSYEYCRKAMNLHISKGKGSHQQLETKMGAIASRWGLYDEAINYFDKAIKSSQKNKDKKTLANIYRLKGNLEGKRNNYEKASNYLTEAYDIYVKSNDKDGISKVYLVRGDIARENKKYECATEHYISAYSYADNFYFKCVIMGELCRIYAHLGDKSVSQKWKDKIEDMHDRMSEKAQNYVDICIKEAKNLLAIDV